MSISKTKFTKEEQHQKKSILNKEYKRQYYLKHKEKIKQRARLYKIKHSHTIT